MTSQSRLRPQARFYNHASSTDSENNVYKTTLPYEDSQPLLLLPGPARGPARLEKAEEEEKVKSQLELRCLEKKGASLGARGCEYEIFEGRGGENGFWNFLFCVKTGVPCGIFFPKRLNIFKLLGFLFVCLFRVIFTPNVGLELRTQEQAPHALPTEQVRRPLLFGVLFFLLLF